MFVLCLQPHTEREEPAVGHGGDPAKSPLQRWAVTTLFTPEESSGAEWNHSGHPRTAPPSRYATTPSYSAGNPRGPDPPPYYIPSRLEGGRLNRGSPPPYYSQTSSSEEEESEEDARPERSPVSYTHLTLPTTVSV